MCRREERSDTSPSVRSSGARSTSPSSESDRAGEDVTTLDQPSPEEIVEETDDVVADDRGLGADGRRHGRHVVSRRRGVASDSHTLLADPLICHTGPSGRAATTKDAVERETARSDRTHVPSTGSSTTGPG